MTEAKESRLPRRLLQVAGVALGSFGLYYLYSRYRACPKRPCPLQSSASKTMELPIVDLDESEEEQARQLQQACIKHGFFYVRNHGILEDLQAAAIAQSRAVFGMDRSKKLELLLDRNNRGWAPMTKDKPETAAGEVKSATAKPITKESFFIGREVKAGSEESADYMQGPNQWPREADCPGFRQTMNCYFDELWDLGLQLTGVIVRSLDVHPSCVESASLRTKPMLLMRLLHYDQTKSDPAQGVFAAVPHTDYGILTILTNDGEPGLEICVDDEWRTVAAIPGCFIVNIGDMLEKWTGGLYKSTLHRVVHTSGNDRFSIPFFFEPNVNCTIKSLVSEADDGVVSGEHVKHKSEAAAAEQL